MCINVSKSGDYYGFGSLFIFERGGAHSTLIPKPSSNFLKSDATKNNYDAKI